VGAVATFVGLVRDLNEGAEVSRMTLEHYPGMTERALEEICAEAAGALGPDRHAGRAPRRSSRARRCLRLVAVSSAHRGDAFAACEFFMDYLKTRAPFWKKESTLSGERWVEARTSDDEAAARWSGAGNGRS